MKFSKSFRYPAAADDEDVEAEVNEAAFQELSDYVMANIQPTHPICYDSFNLCQLMSKSKLSTFERDL